MTESPLCYRGSAHGIRGEPGRHPGVWEGRVERTVVLKCDEVGRAGGGELWVPTPRGHGWGSGRQRKDSWCPWGLRGGKMLSSPGNQNRQDTAPRKA